MAEYGWDVKYSAINCSPPEAPEESVTHCYVITKFKVRVPASVPLQPRVDQRCPCTSCVEFGACIDLKLQELQGLPGLVVYARRGDHVYHAAHGFSNVEQKVALSTSAVFRMYSMTKVDACTCS